MLFQKAGTDAMDSLRGSCHTARRYLQKVILAFNIPAFGIVHDPSELGNVRPLSIVLIRPRPVGREAGGFRIYKQDIAFHRVKLGISRLPRISIIATSQL